ncbi:hypothetical protein GW534_15560 [Bacillus sp. P1(2020)]|uniref:Uncharacterized protein n=1 Tax=Pallidibacillus pasinlerensis TaxID=2703818 RepID=A0ABX0A6K3_9BACI|nr:hypothetical protein [Pallidibacillus pasinlerensis]
MVSAIKISTKRVPFYELAVIADGGTVRTFSKEIYRIRGVIARNVKTNEVVKLSKIYYEIRTVMNRQRQVVAKRKNPSDELKRVII